MNNEAANTASSDAADIADENQKTREVIERKIVHALTHFPAISSTMLQYGIGPSISPDIWRPILNRMIDEGRVSRDELAVTGPSGRSTVIQRLRLSSTSRDLLEQAVKGLAA